MMRPSSSLFPPAPAVPALSAMPWRRMLAFTLASSSRMEKGLVI